jgi:hypothetical protein
MARSNRTTSPPALRPAVALLLSACFLSTSIRAYPSGPGSCPGGMAATDGSHVAPNPVPTFQQMGYEFLVDGQVVPDSTFVTTLTIGTPYEIAVRATKDPFRGGLIRLDGGVPAAFTAGTNALEAQMCPTTAPGIGHFDKLDKMIMSGNYQPYGAGRVTVDVTIVQVNSGGQSVYSYEQFRFTVVEDVAPTEAPAVAPTKTPVVAPTQAPVVDPTKAPVVAPTKAPVVAPTKAPAVAPTEAPAVARTAAPVVAPTEAPAVAPVAAPVAMAAPVTKASPPLRPSVRPAVAPTDFPTRRPTNTTSVPVATDTAAPTVADPVAAEYRFWYIIIQWLGWANTENEDGENLRRLKL